MTALRARSSITSIGVLFCIAACGGGGGGSSGPSPASNTLVDASPGGIWTGKDSVTGLTMLGLMSEQGEFHFIRSDDVQYTGTAMTLGGSISADFTGVTPAGYLFPDGSNAGSGTVSGTIEQRQSITASVTFTTSAGLSDTSPLSLSYHPLYARESSLPTIAGNYVDLATGSIVNIAAGGIVFSQDADTGCVMNGRVSVIDSRFNVYRIQWTYEGCVGASGHLNGLSFNGLATLDNTIRPEYGIVGATAVSQSTRYSMVLLIERT